MLTGWLHIRYTETNTLMAHNNLLMGDNPLRPINYRVVFSFNGDLGDDVC